MKLDLSVQHIEDVTGDLLHSYSQRQLASDPPTPSSESDASSGDPPSPIVVGLYGVRGVGRNTFLRGSELADRDGTRARMRTMEIDQRRVRFEITTDPSANPHVCLVLFDLTQIHTLEATRAIIHQIRERRRPSLDETLWWRLKCFPVILVGNKLDQASNLVPTTAEMAEIVASTGIADSALISLKRKDNLEVLYRTVARVRWNCEEVVGRQLVALRTVQTPKRREALPNQERRSVSAITLSEREKERCVLS